MNRIEKLFREKNKNILSLFFTAGFPELDSTIHIAKQLEHAGVDMIEIGIPFSDPMADGPTIQESNKIAIDNGMTLKNLLKQVALIRKEVSMPIILMGYLNPILQYEFDKFCQDAAASGVDGLIIPDIPLDDFDTVYKRAIESAGLKISFLVSPTTSVERIRKIDEFSSGFIYSVSSSSTTGAQRDFSAEQEKYFDRLQSMRLKNPFLIGFGISSHSTFNKACQYGAGAIIGSAFIRHIKDNRNAGSVSQFVKSILQ